MNWLGCHIAPARRCLKDVIRQLILCAAGTPNLPHRHQVRDQTCLDVEHGSIDLRMTDVVQRVAAAGHALAGRLLEAQQMMVRLCAFDPFLRLSNLAEVLPPFYRPDDRSRYIEGLRKAGLPD
ncbi:hypothetical protein [Mesorhizobium sp.]|uniref:hypothetical protein n=1 Tax=Mesorhizobium sp. TaxID=1871066 RepID=UPI00257CDDE6|nr:hypothetical protein [Mesorhizobium sp.]